MLAVLCEELVRFRDKGVKKAELAIAKGYLEGTMLSSIETSWAYLNWYAKDELLWPDKVESVEERISRLKKVTSGDVQRVAKKYITGQNWYLAVVGDVSEKDIKVEL